MKHFAIALSFLSVISLPSLNAQDISDTKSPQDGRIMKNLLKVNLTGIVVKNYSLQYERLLSRKTSIALSFRTMPTTSIPLQGLILNFADDDPTTKQVLDKLQLSNFAITPEFRWYLGKGDGRGLYVAPFYRYASFKTNELVYEYDYGNTTESITLRGDQTSHTFGALLGAQWFLGKSLLLDWWIAGPHYGFGKGNLNGITDHILSPDEQNTLREALEDTKIPFADKDVSVSASSANIKLSGGWAGFRAGLSLGFRF